MNDYNKPKSKQTKPVKKIKKHYHKWEDHCDCEYCSLLVCLKCGEERDASETKKLWSISKK